MSALEFGTSAQCHACHNNYSMQKRPLLLNCGDTFCETCIASMRADEPAACVGCQQVITSSTENRALEAAFADMAHLARVVNAVKKEMQQLKDQVRRNEVQTLIEFGEMKLNCPRDICGYSEPNHRQFAHMQESATKYFTRAIDHPDIDSRIRVKLILKIAEMCSYDESAKAKELYLIVLKDSSASLSDKIKAKMRCACLMNYNRDKKVYNQQDAQELFDSVVNDFGLAQKDLSESDQIEYAEMLICFEKQEQAMKFLSEIIRDERVSDKSKIHARRIIQGAEQTKRVTMMLSKRS